MRFKMRVLIYKLRTFIDINANNQFTNILLVAILVALLVK